MFKSTSTLKITAIERHADIQTPHLMPFHITYSGPAPISTYFRINSTPEPTYGRHNPPQPLLSSESSGSVNSQNTLVADSANASMDIDIDKHNGDCHRDATTVPHLESRHFSASFRGRAMHGVEVGLPDGYAGVVLRSPDDAKKMAPKHVNHEERKPKLKGRATRRFKRMQEAEEVELEEDADNGAAVPSEEPARILRPVSTFSSFVLWHPDIAVDEGRDEYLRSLTEWTRLATEIHRVEEC